MTGQSNHRFLKACRREPVDCTPVWFMRQAGRYMAEYREIRKKHDILTVCKTPELSAEVTLQPVKSFDIDAAIIFADILLPLEPMGIDLEFTAGEGPVIHNPVRDSSAVNALKEVDGDSLRYVGDAIRLAQKGLQAQPCPVPLIGFAGAPFTLASYMLEGGSSRNYIHTKGMMYSDPRAWHALMKKLSHVIAEYLRSQIHAGAQVVQLFDSWVGCLNPDDYREYVLPHVQHIISSLRNERVPIIHFGTGTATLLELMKEAGGDVIGVDWRVNIDDAWTRLGPDVAVQGNLDPVTLFAPIPEIQRRVADIMRRAAKRPGHIFNLGHGILPQTPVEHVQAVTRMVHELSACPS
ncbi:MAG TPA: uroporphyrinogen decarboxylase [Nitrospirales bacterium]|nr:uroporphyrinogen decarboxylase [Nitrospirales bacterium]